MLISRRQFLKYCSIAAGAIGLTATDLMKLEKALATNVGTPVVWVAGQACTGCTMSLANSVYYTTLQDLLLLGNPSDTLELKMHETLMSAMGTVATMQSGLTSEGFALVVEGAIPTNGSVVRDGYCEIGTYAGAASENIGDIVKALATNANCAAILSVGTCASFGGIPAAAGNQTGAKGVLDWLKTQFTGTTWQGVRKKTINIPGCPPNPNWIVGTIAYLIANGLAIPSLDALRRPRTYYGERICNSCLRFENSKGPNGTFLGVTKVPTPSGLLATGQSVNQPDMIGSPVQNQDATAGYCLKKAGCKGSRTKSDCSLRRWHSPGFSQIGVNWCVGAGAPCQGCTQNYFPDRMSPFHYIR